MTLTVAGCQGWVATQMGMMVHFLHHYVWDTMDIVEGGGLPHQQCLHCDIMVPRATLNFLHLNTSQCDKGMDRK